jgi:hypothetical protein
MFLRVRFSRQKTIGRSDKPTGIRACRSTGQIVDDDVFGALGGQHQDGGPFQASRQALADRLFIFDDQDGFFYLRSFYVSFVPDTQTADTDS